MANEKITFHPVFTIKWQNKYYIIEIKVPTFVYAIVKLEMEQKYQSLESNEPCIRNYTCYKCIIV